MTTTQKYEPTDVDLRTFLTILATHDARVVSTRGKDGVLPGGAKQEAINQVARRSGLAVYDRQNSTGLMRWRLTDAGRAWLAAARS